MWCFGYYTDWVRHWHLVPEANDVRSPARHKISQVINTFFQQNISSPLPIACIGMFCRFSQNIISSSGFIWFVEEFALCRDESITACSSQNVFCMFFPKCSYNSLLAMVRRKEKGKKEGGKAEKERKESRLMRGRTEKKGGG